MKKRIIILGCTGSIGRSAIKVIHRLSNLFEIVGLSAHTDEKNLIEIAAENRVKNLTLSGKKPESQKIEFTGNDSLLKMIEETDAEIVINGISGAAGLFPSVSALSTGKDLALANKETIVMAGPLIRKLAAEKHRKILPVDSEHSAVFQLIKNSGKNEIEEIILTASGGAFRDTPVSKLKTVTVKDALAHPTWDMGKKITIDSATMANKGLEVIEANRLFDIEVSKIKVLIHPQSCVHSLIRTKEGSMYAQISSPDMCIPIQNALTYPLLEKSGLKPLDLAGTTLSFEAPDTEKYPMLNLAFSAAEKGDAYPLAYNAANEVAAEAFINGKIGYPDIFQVVKETLNEDWGDLIFSFEKVDKLDKKARETADNILLKHFTG